MDVRFAEQIQNQEKKKKFNLELKWLKNPASLFYYALLLFVLAFGFYFLMLVQNGFILNYSGDFAAQYIPMAFHVWDYWRGFFGSGHITLFDEAIYLGNSTIGSDAYYGLYSPFNILIVMFPRGAVPYMMSLTSMVKIVCAGLIFRKYIKYLGTKESTARLAGLAYAFVGWMAFYLWYNNYQDVYVFFPLVLFGVEKAIRERKPWVLAVGVFLLSISNYVLMMSYIIMAFIYAMFRFLQRVFKNDGKTNLEILGVGFIGFAMGILLASSILIPAFFMTINSPKVTASKYWVAIQTAHKKGDIGKVLQLIFSWDGAMDQHGRILSYRSMYPILNFFIPTTTCRSMPSLIISAWDFDDISTSLWCFTPMMIFLVPAVIQSIKEKRISHILALLFFLLALSTPFMYFLLMGFTNLYARWTLFVATSLMAYVALYIDRIPNVKKTYLHFGALFALCGIISSWIITETIPRNFEGLSHRFIFNGNDYTTLIFIVEILYLLIVYIVVFMFYNKKKVMSIMMGFVGFEAICMGTFVTNGHGSDFHLNNGYQENYELYGIIKDIKSKDQNFYRYYTALNDAYSDENGLMNNYSSGTYFHSLYNFNIDYFTRWCDMRSGETAVGGRYRNKAQDIDSLLAVKYYIVDRTEQRTKADLLSSLYPNSYRANVPLDFVKSTEEKQETNRFVTYVNNNAQELGYTYDTMFAYNRYNEKSFTKIYTGGIYAIKNAIGMMENAILSYDDVTEINRLSEGVISRKEGSLYPSEYESSLKRFPINGYNDSYQSDYRTTFYNTGDIYSKNYEINKIVDIPTTLPKISFDKADPMRYFAFIEKEDGTTFDEFEDGTSVYIWLPFTGSKKYDIYLINENNEIITYDDHDDHSTDNNSYIRGFYSNQKIKKIAYCGKYGASKDIPSLYLEKGSAYKTRVAARTQYKIENVKYSQDRYEFTTNFTNELGNPTQRLVVTKVAYDQGWSVKAKYDNKTVDLKTYNGNGGFVTFLTPNTASEISYVMSYSTPYSGVAAVLAGLSLGGFFISLYWYQYRYYNKKMDGLLEEFHP